MGTVIKILLVICVIYLLMILCENKENLYHIALSCVNRREFASVPTNPTLLTSINKVLGKNIRNKYQYTFIDFGSGFGTLLEQMRHKYVKLIGVEPEKVSHEESTLKLRMYENIVLENKPMEEFVFPDEDIILYMYEPLFLLNDCSKRREIYNQVIGNLAKYSKKAYVIYIQSNRISHFQKGCDFDFNIFTNHGFRLINHSTSNLWPLSRSFYLFGR